MLSKYPELSTEDVIATLRVQAEDLGEEGWDQYYGWGLVDAYAAVSQTPIPEFSTSSFMLVILLGMTIVFVLLKKVIMHV